MAIKANLNALTEAAHDCICGAQSLHSQLAQTAQFNRDMDLSDGQVAGRIEALDKTRGKLKAALSALDEVWSATEPMQRAGDGVGFEPVRVAEERKAKEAAEAKAKAEKGE
jgi:hypothetical protein